jgi:hypothetical protein
MKIFISWSGERSKLIAEHLRKWVPKVIQAIEPWMSKEDISSGARWSNEVFKELEETKVGIICITPENQHNPWIQFESGALSKSIEQTYVIPYLFDMIPTNLSGPLVQFQAVISNKEGTLKLLLALNKALGEKGLVDTELEEVFDVWWHKLDENINKIPEFQGKKSNTRTEKEILTEILENTREQLRKEDIRLNSVLDKENDLSSLIGELKVVLKPDIQNKKVIDIFNKEGINPKNLNVEKLIKSFEKFNMPIDMLDKVIEKQKLTTKDLMKKKDDENSMN